MKSFGLAIITILSLVLIISVNCAYRQNAYKIFDKYTLIDLVRKSVLSYFL